jgi:ZIP family zinc transporter
MLMTGPASAGVALIAMATLAGAWLAGRASRMRAASLACAAGVLVAVVLADLLPDIWRDLRGAGLPWWAAAIALGAGVAGADGLTRRGCACRSVAGYGVAGGQAAHRDAAHGGAGRGGATATALGVHRALEGAALVLTGSVGVIAALIVHASSEGFAMAALLSAERRRKAVALLAITCLSPAVGAIAVSQVRLPAQTAPILTALVAGVLLRAAATAGQAALAERRLNNDICTSDADRVIRIPRLVQEWPPSQRHMASRSGIVRCHDVPERRPQGR